MASGAEYFLKHTLGEDFLQSLNKVELWKPGTKSTTDHEEIRTALQIVPRTIIALLIRELSPMLIGDTKEIQLPVQEPATLTATKHERDVYSGDIVCTGKKVTEFKFRSIPGIGLVIMSTFELYDMENLINKDQHEQVVTHDYSGKVGADIQREIDKRLALHDLIGKVVDKKIMEREAVHQLVMRKLTEMMEPKKAETPAIEQKPIHVPKDLTKQEQPAKKKRPLTEFLEKAKKKHEYSVVMAKGEQVDCPDCGHNLFDGKVFAGCVCLGADMERKVFIKKEQDGIKVRFSKGWDEENIEMLLDVLRRKNG